MNTVIVAIDHTPASRQQAISAAHLAASLNRHLHLVFGVKTPFAGIVNSGVEEFYCDSLSVADSVAAGLCRELSEIVTVTSSVLATSPRAAMRHEAKRLGASPVVTRRNGVFRVLGQA